MQQSESIANLTKALVQVQAELKPVKRESTNDYLGTRYASLAECWEAVRALLTSNGLAVIQTMEPGTNGSVHVATTLAHTSGEWTRGVLDVHPVKADPQSLGSAISYGRRYSLAAVLGLASGDDDGEQAMNRSSQPAQPRGQSQPTPNQGQQQRPPQSPPQSQGAQSQGQGQGQQWPASEKQRKAIFAISKQKQLDPKQVAGELLGRTVGSLNDLSSKEASLVIEHLNSRQSATQTGDAPF